MEINDKYTLVNCDESYITLIEENCDKNEISKYMSRFWPSEREKIYVWKLIISDDCIIGNVWFEPTEKNNVLKLGIVIWEEKKLGIGIGKKVIQELIEYIALRDPEINTVMLNVRKTNDRALACYKNAGFTIIGEYSKMKNGERIEFYRMEYELPI